MNIYNLKRLGDELRTGTPSVYCLPNLQEENYLVTFKKIAFVKCCKSLYVELFLDRKLLSKFHLRLVNT